jgi:hypothetical protein
MVSKEEVFASEIKEEKIKINENLQDFLKGKVIADAIISFTDIHEIDAIILKFEDKSCARFTRYGVQIKEFYDDLSESK